MNSIARTARTTATVLMLFGGLLLLSITAMADDLSPRLRVGLNLAPAFAQALDAPKGPVQIWMVYVDNPDAAGIDYLKKRLAKRDGKLVVKSIALDRLSADGLTSRVMLMPAESMSDEQLGRLLALARQWRLLSYSPYEGDVERGVLGGVQVTDRILPLINLHTLKTLDIQLKAFFYKVAAKYAP